MKIFRWMGFAYLLLGFLISLWVCERYIYYATGLFGYTPTHSHYAEEDLKYYDYQPFGCKLGKGTLGAFRYIPFSNYTYTNLIVIVKSVCTIATGHSMMGDELFDSFGVPVYTNLMEKNYDVNYMCSAVSLCDDYHYEAYDINNYLERVLKDQPSANRKYPKNKPQKLYKMFHISDAHVDRNYLEGTATECKSSTGGRPLYGPGEGDERAGYWGHVGKGDIPMITAESGIKAMIDKDPDFIIWTGDNIDHYIFLQTFENQFFNQRYLKKYIVDILNYTKPIYPVLGNHEGVPTDMFNITQNQWVLQTFADIWIDYLTPEAHYNLSNYGYYHMQHLDTNLRIIGTFSLVYDIQNWHLLPNHTDPLGELKFLEETLAYCEDNGEVVYILGHIPPGDVFVLGEWSVRFRALVNRYTNIIRGQFYGHTHYDEFKNVKSYKEDEKSAGIVWATPSFTSFPRKQPSLRMWEVDSETWHLWDYTQYRLYLNKTNKAVDELKKRNPKYTDVELKATAKWEVAYTFRNYFGISMEFEEISRFIDRIKTDRSIATKVIKMMHCEGPDSDSRQDEQFWTYGRYSNSVFDDHWACNGHSGNMLDYLFQGIQMAHGNSGDWWHKEPVEKYTRQS